MNILFLIKTFGIGGVEVVTSTLAESFSRNGHKVCIFAFSKADNMLEERLNSNITLYIGYGYKYDGKNIHLLRDILIKENINYIVNQWGLPFLPIKVIIAAKRNIKVKVISVFHNQVDTNGRLKSVEMDINLCDSHFLRCILMFKYFIYKSITSFSMTYVYNHSDIYMVLSPSFIQRFKNFTGLKNPKKLVVQTNPITININDIILDTIKKEKEIIYVGRLDFVQKRVYRIIDTWNYIEDLHPNWRLTIIGDGEDRLNLEAHVRALNLKHVSFEGFKDPLQYYKRASMLLLTSDFEGFPLVLAECMSLGVIPIVYNSYSAVGDIIEDMKDGVIIPYRQDGYNAFEAASLLNSVINDDSLRNKLMQFAIKKSENYKIETISKQWMKLLNDIQLE